MPDPKSHGKLEEILKIEDKTARQAALVDYAFALKINPKKARKEDGTFDEDELTVLIYDAQEVSGSGKREMAAVMVGCGIVVLILLAIMFLAMTFFFKNS